MNTKVVVRYGQEIDLSYERKGACVRCQSEGRDRSGDNAHYYGLDENGKHKGCHCFSCGFSIPSEEHMEKSGFVYEYNEEFFNLIVNFIIKQTTHIIKFLVIFVHKSRLFHVLFRRNGVATTETMCSFVFSILIKAIEVHVVARTIPSLTLTTYTRPLTLIGQVNLLSISDNHFSIHTIPQ